MKRVWVTLVSILVIGGAGYFGWQSWGKKPDNKTNNGSNQQQNLTKYTNSELGVSFSYPKEWGEVELKEDFGGVGNKFLGYFGKFKNSQEVIFRIYSKDADGTDKGGGGSSLHYKDFCVDDGVIAPIITYASKCNKLNVDNNGNLGDFKNAKLLNNDTIIFDSLRSSGNTQSSANVINAVGLIARLNKSPNFPTLTLSAPSYYKEQVTQLGGSLGK